MNQRFFFSCFFKDTRIYPGPEPPPRLPAYLKCYNLGLVADLPGCFAQSDNSFLLVVIQ